MYTDTVFMKSPHTGEIKEVEATEAVLVPLMVAGWQQVQQPVTPAQEDSDGR